ncbi:MAG TPA: hypothetical protein VLG92_02170 [Candidatus Saccharimonadia bacterium]|nr:hypothetical protein [Candidatus Saccharimonadia bacterium]
MSERRQDLIEQWPYGFNEQPPNLHADFVLGAKALSDLGQMEEDVTSDSSYWDSESAQTVVDGLDIVRQNALALRGSIDPWDKEKAAFIRRHYRRIVIPGRSPLADETPLPASLPSSAIQADVLEWMETAPNESLLTLLRWNEQRLRPVQERLVARTREFHADILSDTEWLVEAGRLPGHVVADGLMEKAIQATVVHVVDPFAMPRPGAGYYDVEGNPPTIGVLDVCVDDEELYRILLHEYIHSLELFVQTLRYMYGSDPDLEATILNEAFVEDCTVAAMRSNPQVTAPFRQKYTGVYSPERRFSSVYSQASELASQDWANAYGEPWGEGITPHHASLREKVAIASGRLFPELSAGLGETIVKEYNAAKSPDARRAVVALGIGKIVGRCGIELPTSRANIGLALEAIGDEAWRGKHR